MSAVAVRPDVDILSARATLFRLEMADALRSRWVVFSAVAYVGVFGLFTWLGLRESSVLGFTGLSRVVLNASNAIVLVLPLVALVATSQSVVRSRGTGYFELMLSHPCRRSDWFTAVVASRVAVLLGPLVAILLVTAVLGQLMGERVDTALLANTAVIAGALIWAFVGIGLFVSVAARSSERAIVASLVVWLVVATLHDFAIIGLLLRVHLNAPAVFALSAANPVEMARLAILSVVDPELSVLGPVGFWLANTLGPRWTLAAGIAWPAFVGSVVLLLAARRFEKADLVG